MNAAKIWMVALLLTVASPVAWGRTATRAQEATRAEQAQRVREAVRLDRPPRSRSEGRRPSRQTPIFLPIVDGELLIDPFIGRFSRRHFFGPAGSFYRSEEHASEQYWPGWWRPRVRSRQLVIGRGSPDLPGTVYLYDPDFPAGYDTYYFPRQAAPPVVVESPTVPEPEPAEEAPENADEEHSGFGSDLSPMLGGGEYVNLYFALGEARLSIGDYSGAVEALQLAVGAEPESPVPKLALAAAAAAYGDYRMGAHALRRGLRATPDWNAIEVDFADVFGAKTRREQVLAGLGAAVDRHPEDPDARLLLAFCHFAEGRPAEAENVLERPEGEAESVDPVQKALRDEIRLRMRQPEVGAPPAGQSCDEG